jgi:hypothetical protein
LSGVYLIVPFGTPAAKQVLGACPERAKQVERPALSELRNAGESKGEVAERLKAAVC